MRRPSKWDAVKREAEPLVPPERLRHDPATYQDPVIVLSERGHLTPAMEQACDEYRSLWRFCIAVPTHPKGTLDDSTGRALKEDPSEETAARLLAKFNEVSAILGADYGLFRDVVIFWQYPFYRRSAFIDAAQRLARAWRMEMRRAS